MLDASRTSTGSFQFIVDQVIAWLAPLTAIVSLASTFLGDALKGGETGSGWRAATKKIISKTMIWIAGLALPALLWFVYLRIVATGITSFSMVCPQRPGSVKVVYCYFSGLPFAGLKEYLPAVLCLLAALAIAMIWNFLSPNGNSLHRLYRERLGKAFCFRWTGNDTEENDRTPLSKLAEQRPYHLVNAAINVQNSPVANAKGRNADFFLFSPLFTGSEATQYRSTKALETYLKEKKGVHLDIATAIAISGAAISSNMGSETIKPMALTLALLNFRLGYWFPNPAKIDDTASNRISLWYFMKEAFGLLDETDDIVYLTDGGHIENLGVYELLKRRCKLVIAVDAEADSGMTFPSLIKLQRFARIDLGARIEMKWSLIQSVSLATQKNAPDMREGPHCSVGRIEYDNGGVGILLYVKSSVTGDENDYIKDYNRRYRDFPHESTGDQFFSEEQFEVYRALGFHAVDGALKGKHTVQTLDGEDRLSDPKAQGFGIRQLREFLGIAAAPASAPRARRRSRG
jgi:hypothetical protein